MARLLLQENIDKLKGEYAVRFFTVATAFLIVALIIFSGVLFAALLQVSIAGDIVQDQMRKINSTELAADRKALTEKLDLLDEQIKYVGSKVINPSILIETLDLSSGAGVSLDGLQIETQYTDADNKVPGKIIKITFRGLAETRAELLAFQDRLGKSDLFAKIDIPYSNFAQTTDISFTATLFSDKSKILNLSDEN
ncbi:MAG TPA: hypothetical protein P5328_00470 [Candidatus Paceibacterota bacterium]|nr:hypothetical protein [Candidatus Paceibacterota bacterium]HRZ34201.1 hypothetical protein [Candidatus Paceibacterota bacterium]